MIASAILKCLLLANAEVLILEMPVNEYAMATIEKTFNDVHFEGTVVEGKLNSVRIKFPKLRAETLSFAPLDYQNISLATHLSVQGINASLDCEVR